MKRQGFTVRPPTTRAPSPSHFRIYRTGGLAARPDSCRRIAARCVNLWTWESRNACVVIDGGPYQPAGDDRSLAMTGHSVVIAGAGPTGLMLAGELALAGVDVAIVERRANQDLAGSRAGGLHSRTIEILDQRGIADRFLSQGQVYPTLGFHMMRLDISDFPTR